MKAQWMLDDAVFLDQNGRKRSALCLLLCLVDALAKVHGPQGGTNRKRYVGYLNRKLAQLEGGTRHTLVDEKGRDMDEAEIIYEFFRCNIVHEGDSRDDQSYGVQVEYEPTGRFWVEDAAILMDRQKQQIVYRYEPLRDVLLKVARSELT